MGDIIYKMKVMFVYAHPDDESFGSGGTIAKLAKKGIIIKLITATRGEAGQFGDLPIKTQKELAKVREQELKSAAKILGISQIYFLDYIDGTLEKIPLKELAKKVFSILEDEKPDVVITFSKEGGSKHPDHVKMHKVTTVAFKKYMQTVKKHIRLYYGVSLSKFIKKLERENLMHFTFGRVRGVPFSKVTTSINISDSLETKIKALKCHLTQKKDWERFIKRLDFKEIKHEYFILGLENEIV